MNANDVVKVAIDWNRRYQLMRLHFAAEIVLELVYQKFPDINKVGAHISQNKARIDFEWDGCIFPLISQIQGAAQSIIDANQPIISAFSDEKTERRYWQINKFSQVSCGGDTYQNDWRSWYYKAEKSETCKE